MADKKIIAVVGATGAQGGGLVKAILEDKSGEYGVRALVRDPNSDKAKALAQKGAEVVKANLDDPASVKAAFKGAYGAFCVTFFWDHMSPDKEREHVKVMAEAAKEAGLKHVVWSTLEDTRKWVPLDDARMPTLMDKYKVPHFDAKGESDKVFADLGVPTTNLLTSFYWDNFIHFGMGPKKNESGEYQIVIPMDTKKLPGIAAKDIGRCAFGVFKQGPKFVGQTIGIAGEHLSGAEMAKSMSAKLGIEVKFQSVEPEVYRSFGFPGADDLGNMFQFKRDFEDDFRKPRDPAFAKSLNPSLQSFDTWLQNNKTKIPIE